MAVAVFDQTDIQGYAIAEEVTDGLRITARFTRLPPGRHGFHIHKAGDLRGEGCAGACEHFHVGPGSGIHGDRPRSNRQTRKRSHRHTGDLGNIEITRAKGGSSARYFYFLPSLRPSDLWGRALIIHADEDDLGRGGHPDSHTTGHSGARIGCAIFGRIRTCQ
jgi:Cu-Zn family superoxide dismutase